MSDQPTTGQAARELTVREAMLPPKLRDWRAKLSAKAKQEKRFRFYSLYGLVSHPETLKAAWAQVRANGGGPGVDGVTIEMIEREGEETFLAELARELREKTYRAGAVRRVYIPKSNGNMRPPGIPNIRDRVVRYWNMHPSKKSMARERERLRGMIDKRQCHTPLPELIGRLNRHLRGWANYYRPGYSSRTFRQINHFVRARLTRHLRRRSQRAWQPANGQSIYSQLEKMGLIYL